MKVMIKLVFNDWLDQSYNSVYETEEGWELTKRMFHSGSTFTGEIDLHADEVKELEIARAKGFRPVFELIGV